MAQAIRYCGEGQLQDTIFRLGLQELVFTQPGSQAEESGPPQLLPLLESVSKPGKGCRYRVAEIAKTAISGRWGIAGRRSKLLLNPSDMGFETDS